MDDLLKPVSTKKIQVIEGTNDQDAIQEMPKAEETQPKSSSDILETLHEKPTVSQVAQCLNFLVSPHSDRQNVKLPSPTTSQIINVLATKTLVDFWELLDRDTSSHEIKANLLSIFRSVSGLGGILGRLKSLIKERRQNKSTVGVSYQLRILLRVLALTLEPLSCSETVWNDILSEPGHNEGRRALLWKEYVSSVGSGLLSSMVAQAEAAVKEDKEAFDATWLSNGPSFADWLGGNVVSMTKGPTSSEASTWTAISQLSSKCLSFGYIGMSDFKNI